MDSRVRGNDGLGLGRAPFDRLRANGGTRTGDHKGRPYRGVGERREKAD